MSHEERERWNARYRGGDHAGESPSAVLTAVEGLLPRSGRALDVAGGAGRHALWLARRGLDVTITDIAVAGLALAAERAHAAGLKIAARQADLENEPLPAGPWDLIVVFHFLLRPLHTAADWYQGQKKGWYQG